ncbi:hypothetical protein FB645_005950 [Coemansia sp. IMI 203386]|nr:hypothetical protein FB645_005950 [Coemansia sp. IMI 203386]
MFSYFNNSFALAFIVLGYTATLAFAKVQMNIYLMSRCPDAARAMRDLSAVYYDNSKELDMHFDYIGELNNSTTYGVECPHGDIDAGTSLQFILCQQREIKKIGTYSQLAQCLLGIPTWLPTMQCALGTEGIALLQNSVKTSREKDMQTSLSFALNDAKRCVFDSGHWVGPDEGCPGGGSVPRFTKSIKDLEAREKKK